MANVGGNLHLIIRDERIKQGLSQKKLGELVDLPQQAINRIEHGQRKLDVELFEKICEVLNIKKIGNFNINSISNFYKLDDEPGTPDIYLNGLTDDVTQSNTIIIDTCIDESHPFNILQEKVKSGKKLTEEERAQYDTYVEHTLNSLSGTIKRLGEYLKKYYSLLNDIGREKADEQMSHAVEQIEMLTKIPEYQIKEENDI